MIRFLFLFLISASFILSGNVEASTLQQSPEKIAELENLAKAGDRSAQSTLGYLGYIEMPGVDSSNTPKWLYWSAEQGDKEAQFYLGLSYARGKFVEQSYIQAYFWLYIAAKSCPECRPDKQLIYAARLADVKKQLTDVQMKRMEELANEWRPFPSKVQVLKMNAAHGNADAKYQLGKLYAEGKTIPRNIIIATQCLNEASEMGHKEAKSELESMGDTSMHFANPDAWHRLGVPPLPPPPVPPPCGSYPF
ncbi:MAG: tetratricopeptide repeat protein [Micavibrio sp.]|nr:tetratricopeptide repeat protein [Micavibrio sp.]